MSATLEPLKKVWTEAELWSLPEDGYLHEVVDGELVMSPKTDFFHGSISVRLSAALLVHAEAHRLGEVLDSSTGFWMKNRNLSARRGSRRSGLSGQPGDFFRALRIWR